MYALSSGEVLGTVPQGEEPSPHDHAYGLRWILTSLGVNFAGV